ncbi:hypothetical protein ES703_38362 [subsurface metagenome]
MTSAIAVTRENHFASSGFKKPIPVGPIKKPNTSRSVTRGSLVRRPIASVIRPRRSKTPSVMNVLAVSSIYPHLLQISDVLRNLQSLPFEAYVSGNM